MMLVGMAFYRWGILSAQRDARFYRRMAAWGFGLGLPLVGWGLFQYYAHHWEATYSLFIGRIPNHLATPLIASGYIALVMLWSRSTRGRGMQERLVAVGRTALSNYIGQSLLGTFLFYGWGLGLFARFDRLALMGFIAGIWALQLALAPWWLRRFRYGPLEWLWRSLSHFRPQPLLRPAAS
ncbi:MAG: DUF418 domain-containing protein [Anaerolineae bacterium]|nr:MAG: DUF418 domain-containing protein [Anaerolineae bacterium]